MNARTLILAILNWQEASGYEIRKQCVEGAFSHFVAISYGSIYPTLAKLAEDGFVTSRREHAPGKPDRNVYSISQQGRLEFIRAMQQPPALDVFKSEFLLVAKAAEYGTPDSLALAIEQRIDYLRGKLDMISGLVSDCDHPATIWVARYAEHCVSCDLQYLEKNKLALQQLAGTPFEAQPAAE